jgi:hypothetical protein
MISAANDTALYNQTPLIKLSAEMRPEDRPYIEEDITLAEFENLNPKEATVFRQGQYISIPAHLNNPENLFAAHLTGELARADVLEKLEPEELQQSVTQGTKTNNSAAQVTTVVKKIKDFSLLDLQFMQEDNPQPSCQMTFCYDIGDYDCYYHKIIITDKAVYLLHDTRHKSSTRFKPKNTLTPLNVIVEGQPYTGYLWVEGQFRLGCLEITPFVLTAPPVQEELKPETQETGVDVNAAVTIPDPDDWE